MQSHGVLKQQSQECPCCKWNHEKHAHTCSSCPHPGHPFWFSYHLIFMSNTKNTQVTLKSEMCIFSSSKLADVTASRAGGGHQEPCCLCCTSSNIQRIFIALMWAFKFDAIDILSVYFRWTSVYFNYWSSSGLRLALCNLISSDIFSTIYSIYNVNCNVYFFCLTSKEVILLFTASHV